MRDRSKFEDVIYVVTYLNTALWVALGWWDKWNQVADNLYVSKIPQDGEADDILNYVESHGERLGMVVSVVEPHEVNESVLNVMSPMSGQDWRNKKVDHVILIVKDFGSKVNPQEAQDVVFNIQHYREKNQAVLLHCKAGRSRSAMIAAIVLALFDFGRSKLHKNKSAEALVDLAIAEILKHRPQIKMSGNRPTAIMLVDEIRKNLKEQAATEEKIELPEIPDKFEWVINLEEKFDLKRAKDWKERADKSFASPELKEEIMKLTSYKQISDYKNKLLDNAFLNLTPKRAEHIKKLLTSIYDAKDSQWYADLAQQMGPSQDLVSAAPSPFFKKDVAKDKIIRESLIDKFKIDVENLLFENLCHTEEEKEALKAIFSLPDQKPGINPR